MSVRSVTSNVSTTETWDYPLPSGGSMENPYHLPDLDRDTVSDLLSEENVGTFCFRDSSRPNNYVLSFVSGGGEKRVIRHVLLSRLQYLSYQETLQIQGLKESDFVGLKFSQVNEKRRNGILGLPPGLCNRGGSGSGLPREMAQIEGPEVMVSITQPVVLSPSFGSESFLNSEGIDTRNRPERSPFSTFSVYVQVIEAKGLPKSDFFGKTDPYCLLEIDGRQQEKTRAIKGKLSPVWNQTYKFSCNLNSILILQVIGSNGIFPKKHFGLIKFKIRELEDSINNQPAAEASLACLDKWLHLTPKTPGKKATGEIHLRIAHTKEALELKQSVDPLPPVVDSLVESQSTLPNFGLEGEGEGGGGEGLYSREQAWESSQNRYDVTRRTLGIRDDNASGPLRSTSRQNSVVSGPVIRTDSKTGLVYAVNENALPEGWEARMTSDGEMFFVNHINRLTQWEDPRDDRGTSDKAQSSLPSYKRNYVRKLKDFREKLKRELVSGQTVISIRRDTIFESSYREIMKQMPQKLKQSLKINFVGEPGVDYGGLSREWFFELSHEIFNPSYGLFEYSTVKNYMLQINPLSSVNPEHLSYFQFVGRIIGLAVFHQKLIDGFFVPTFYKQILGKVIVLDDMALVDPEFHQSLSWVLQNDITEDLGLTFSVEYDEFGRTKTYELIENGNNIEVTNENKRLYVEKMIVWRVNRGAGEQMKHFLKGFNEFISQKSIKMFDEKELELVISGLGEIDVEDWEKNSEYKGYVVDDKQVKWFWKIVKNYDFEKRSRLLQFVTGTSRVPPDGFRALYGSTGLQKFTIEKVSAPLNSLPKAHTCFNRLDLPPYETYEEIQHKLDLAVEFCFEGFGTD